MNLLSQLQAAVGGDRAIELFNQRDAARAEDAPPLTLGDFAGDIATECSTLRDANTELAANFSTEKAATAAEKARADKAEAIAAEAGKRPAVINLVSGDDASAAAAAGNQPLAGSDLFKSEFEASEALQAEFGIFAAYEMHREGEEKAKKEAS